MRTRNIHYWLTLRWDLIAMGLSPAAALERIWWLRRKR